MKFAISYSIVVAILLPLLATADLEFLESKTQQRRNLRQRDGLIGTWGQFHQLGFCVEKIDDLSDATADKVKFKPCDSWDSKQMWMFQHDEDYRIDTWDRTGMIYNMDGGCLAVRGDIEAGKNLKVMRECDDSSNKQQWWSDGDSVTLLEHQDPDVDWSDRLCVQAETFPIRASDPVVLTSCTDSLDN